MNERRGFRLAFPGIFWLTVFFMLPLLFVLAASFMSSGLSGAPMLPLTLEHYVRTFDTFGVIVWRSLRIALYTTVWCLVLGYPLAFFIATRKSATARLIFLFLILLPFWTNFLVRTYALKSILGPEGIINTLLVNSLVTQPLEMLFTPFAVILGLVYGYLPFMVLPVYAAVERLDFRFVEAAYDLGANDWHTFWRVVFPLTLPGVVAGSMLVFIPSIGSFITPDLLGGTRGLMIGNLIARQFAAQHITLGSAISIVLIVLVLIGVIIYIRYGQERQGRMADTSNTPDTALSAQQPAEMRIDEGKLRRDLFVRKVGKVGLFVTPFASYFFLWAPIVVLIVFSFNDSPSVSVWRGFTWRWYENIFAAGSGGASFTTAKLIESLGNSLIVAFSASFIATVIGTMLALAIHRGNFPGKSVVDALLYVPVVIPEITQGVSLAIFFSIVFDYLQNVTGGERLSLGFGTIIIAHVAFNISYVVIVVRARLATMSSNFEEAANDLGANHFQTFWRITFPLLLPGIMAGAPPGTNALAGRLRRDLFY